MNSTEKDGEEQHDNQQQLDEQNNLPLPFFEDYIDLGDSVSLYH